MRTRLLLSMSGLFLTAAVVCPAQVTFTEYPVPTSRSNPYIITAGPDGNLWFTEHEGNKIARITTVGVVTEFLLPTAGCQATVLITPDCQATGIITGPDGNLWFAESNGNQIGRITTAGVITEFPIPTANSYPYGIAAGPDGNLWFVEAIGNQIGKMTPAGVVTEFPIPTANSNPNFITSGPDGNLWFAESTGGNIARITTAGVITEFRIPTAGGNPAFPTAGPDGNVWFVEANGNKIVSITPAGVITEFPIPTAGSVPEGITAGPDGNLWFAEEIGNIARITPAGAITEFPVPSGGVPGDITAGPDGNLWFTEIYGNIISKATLPCTAPAITSLAAAPNVLWPPNHKMGPVAVSVSASGGCGDASCRITSVSSNEPVDADGDWVITGSLTLNLREDRLGNGTGRVYTITVECIDGSGNSTTKTVTVTVPHDQR